MERYKALARFSELCELIKAGAVLCKNYGTDCFNYHLRLNDAQTKEHGASTVVVSKSIGKKFANQSSDVIETKTILEGLTYEYTLKPNQK